MNSLSRSVTSKCLSFGYKKFFSVSAPNNASHSCKLLVIGGGSGGCTIAAKFSRRLPKDAVIVLEPSDAHYYQPLWTLVGAGVKTVAQTRRSAQSVLPPAAKWLRDRADTIDPAAHCVTTKNGDKISYEYVVVAVGLQNDYCKVPGLSEALAQKDSGVSTIFSADYCEKTWADLQQFKGGEAIFTFPDTPIKCPGAPQKIAYLADSHFTRTQVRSKANITYNTCLPVIFGVKKYADELIKVAARKKINVNYKTVLREIRPDKKEALFATGDGKETVMPYNLLHVCPPMKTPAFLRNSPLVDGAGFLDVDKFTLQHKKHPNIYGIGDCTNTPNSKTAAAIAKQCYVLEMNLLATMATDSPKEKYDGYGACPLLTSYNTCILAEFLYDGVVHETLPFNQIPGLKEALDDPCSPVTTVHSTYCTKTWDVIRQTRGGHAIFTYPATDPKCPGAAQKIMYLADDYFRLRKPSIGTIFGVPKYATALQKVASERRVLVNLRCELAEVTPRHAVFLDPSGTSLALPYNLLHVTPPMCAPAPLRQSPLAAAGFLDVDPLTMQHRRYPNVYGLGDCASTPNSKTAAAASRQSHVVELNLLKTMARQPATYKYDGYGACVVMTSFRAGIMAEFLYDGVPYETFPFDHDPCYYMYKSKQRRLFYFLKRHYFPHLYWNRIIKGKWDGRERARRLFRPLKKPKKRRM